MHGRDRRVVVTGLGVISPIGNTVADYWSALLSGTSGVGPITLFDASQSPVRFAGEVKNFDPEEYMDRRTARRMDRFDQLFYAATTQALQDSGIDYSDDPDAGARAGVVVGSGIGGLMSMQEGMDTMRTRGAERISPYQVTKMIPNMAAGDVSIGFGLLGPVTCTVTACAASTNAIGDAAEIIRRGAADVMVSGGGEASICEFGIAAFAQARAVSTRNEDPQGACRPFDATRDGFVMAEGAGSLILEEREHALARGAQIYAELLGYGMSSDAYHITLPRPGGVGAARAMQAALDDAEIEPSQVGYINAHGTSTQANDVTETAAIKLVFGEHAARLAISSTKSMTGHLLGGAGAVEAIASILAMRDGVLPPTINYRNPDPECDLDYVPNKSRKQDIRIVMSNSFGFGGHNAVLIFGK
ncbi:MAG: beta-ketoacyl-ACP synthase II [Gammaproteobacteria bacterium]|nr:beta-ketoacyl-ACP synthase II [Gammaproteobacteria bacterium]